eukprot:GEMP01086781.1.p1 GENE.GEMP01086781.1~~GEMP01086781.1.p1  ORF type:complete len:239 (+),score=55.99 GEMP01086781.1:174-890(+)
MRVFLLHKPKGVISSRAPEHGMTTAYEVLERNVGPVDKCGMVGRLDVETSGALLFTDSSPLFSVIRDKHVITKTYVLTLSGHAGSDFDVSLLEQPVQYTNDKFGEDGVFTESATVRVLRHHHMPGVTMQAFGGRLSDVELMIKEGRNRQIRRLCKQANLKLRHLHRSHIGNLSLEQCGLAEGEARVLNMDEIQQVFANCLTRDEIQAVIDGELRTKDLGPLLDGARSKTPTPTNSPEG